jgi:hypothetical protein
MVNQNTTKKIQFLIPFKNTVTAKRINVTVFEPEEENDGDLCLQMLNAATTCWKKLSDDKEEVAATKLLDEKGCHWVFVLFVVEYYCRHLRPEEKAKHVEFTESMAKLNKRIAKFASRVTKWEAEIDKMNSQIEDELPIDATAYSPEFAAYQAFLRVARVLALPSMMDLKGKKGCVICLYHFAKLSTGKCRYRELADILQARLNADSQHREIDVRDLKDTVKRFKREDPAAYRKSEKTVRTFLKGAPFAAYQLPPADPKETKVTPV